jgi:single-stranded DNA-binding protein
MIDALVAGRLQATPERRTGRNGSTLGTARIRVAAGDDTLLVSVIAFRDDVRDALLALDSGDSVALSGELMPKVQTNKEGATRHGLAMVARAIATPAKVTRRRAAMNPSDDGRDERCPR